jgi:hypothetical protein
LAACEVECEARELPSNGESREFLLWSKRKKNRNANKWGNFGWICGGGGGRREDLKREEAK